MTCIFLLSSKISVGSVASFLNSNILLIVWCHVCTVVRWFKKIESKFSHKFPMFDIKDFYPSIKDGLLIDALEFAKQHVTIKSKYREKIFHARKSLLNKEGEPWIKQKNQ